MLFIDIIVLALLGWFGFKGFKNGLIYEIASILALILGCWAAKQFSEGVALMITGTKLAKPIAFVFIFFVVLLLVHLAGRLGSKVVKLVIPESVDRIFGMLFGCCKVLVVCSVLFYAFQMLDQKEILLKKEFNPVRKHRNPLSNIEPVIKRGCVKIVWHTLFLFVSSLSFANSFHWS